MFVTAKNSIALIQYGYNISDEPAGSVELRLLAASDTEYDQLRKENISTILSYGDTFMDLLCRDACDGLDVGRVSSL